MLLAAANFATALDDRALVREQEEALADAVNTKDKVVFSTLTDKDFHLSWSDGSAVRNFSTDMSREEWMDRLSHLQIDSYEIEISEVSLVRIKAALPSVRSPLFSEAPSAAFVTLQEFWTLLSPRGHRTEKRVKTVDLWVKQQGAWKLASRLCHSDVQ